MFTNVEEMLISLGFLRLLMISKLFYLFQAAW